MNWHFVAIAAILAAGGGKDTRMPNRPQRLTTFGGPDDLWDRAYNQAYMLEPKKGESPAEYYARVPQWQRDLLHERMSTLQSWPVERQYYYRAGQAATRIERLGPVGVSYFLKGPYAAWDLKPWELLRIRAARAGRLWVRFELPDGVLMAQVTDHGPSGAGRPVLDVSPDVAARVRPYWPVPYTLVKMD